MAKKIAVGTGNAAVIHNNYGDFPPNDQLGNARFDASGNLTVGAVQYTGGPVFTLTGDVTTLPTTQPQTYPGFATVQAGDQSFNEIDIDASNPSGETTTITDPATYVVTDNSNPAMFSIAPAIGRDGTLTYTLAPGATGDAQIFVTAAQDGVTSAPKFFTITSAAASTIEVTSTQPAGTVNAGRSVEYDVVVNDATTTGPISGNTQLDVQIILPDGFSPTSTNANGWTLHTDPDNANLMIGTYTVGAAGLTAGDRLPALRLIGSFAKDTYAPVLTAFDGLSGDLQMDADSNLVFNNGTAGATFTAGNAVSFQLTTSDAAALSKAGADALPTGLAFDPATGILSGTPAAGSGGAYTIRFTANAQADQTYTQAFAFTVNEPFTLGAAPATPAFTVGTQGTSQYTVYQYPSTGQAIAITGTLPTGLTTTYQLVGDQQIVTITGTPAAGTAGVYHLTETYSGGSTPITLTVTAPNPAPTISRLLTTAAVYGSAAKAVTVLGSNFIAGTVVDWNGTPLTTTYVSAGRLTAVIPAADFAAAGVDAITVVNPAPGGGTFASKAFTVAKATPVLKLAAPSGTTAAPLATVLGVGQAVVTDGTVTYAYYDAAGKFLSAPPTLAGKYGVRATWAGDANYLPAVSNRVAFTITAPPATTTTDVTPQLTIARGGFTYNARTKTYAQTVTMTNNGVSITGPITLLLNALSATATLVNKSGVTVAAHGATPVGTGYITLSPVTLAAGANVSVILQFAASAVPTYVPQVLSGAGVL